jgi:hypothetical protein
MTRAMPSQQKVREILLSKESSDAEKREQLRALILPDVFKIDDLNKATPAQLKRLQEALAIAEALLQLNTAA